jgi:chloride channel protein, CIC family
MRDWLLSHPTGRWVVLGSCVGMLCGVAAAVFEIGTDLLGQFALVQFAGVPRQVVSTAAIDPNTTTLAFHPLLMLLVMLGGGLLAGVIISRWSMQARGGGIGVVVHAFHHERGHIPLALPWTKLLATIVSLGSGGSGGREGPIALVGAGFASWFAGRLHLTARDRRILLVAGIAGGIAAAFRAPLAAAIFAAEVLYRGPELESDVIIPCFISAVVGYLIGGITLDVLGPLMGHPGVLSSTLFQPGASGFHINDWEHLAGYSVVALASALAARWFIAANDYTARRFELMRIPFWTKPALGALSTGIIALLLYAGVRAALNSQQEAELALATIGSGYGVLHWLFADFYGFHHHLIIAGLLAILAVSKAVTTALTVGSGGSAGLFGPSIVIGGCVGGAVGLVLTDTPIAPPVAACVLMGMAGMLAASHRTPVAAILMVSEVAGTYLLLVPTMWVVGLAFLATGRRSLIAGQVDAIQDSPAHSGHLFADVLATATIAHVLANQRTWTTIPVGADLETCRQLISQSTQDQFPVLRADGKLIGVINRLDVINLKTDATETTLARADDFAAGAGAALSPRDTLTVALHAFHQQRVDELPVTDEQGNFIGMVTSGMLMDYYRTEVERVHAERTTEA